MVFRAVAALIALTAAIVGGPTAGAADPLKMGIFGFFPWANRQADGSLRGVTVDIMRDLERHSGRSIDPVLLPIARAFRDVADGKVDFVLAYRLDSMVPGVRFLDRDLGCATANIVTHRDAGIRSMDDLPGKTIAYAIGGYFHDRYAGRLDIVEVQANDIRQMLLLLLRGRVDGIVLNDVLIDALIHVGPPYEDILPDGWRDAVGPTVDLAKLPITLGVATVSGNEEAIAALDGAIAQGLAVGSLQEIYRAWGSKSGWSCG